MRRRWTLFLILLGGTAMAQTPEALYSAGLAASCAACHGTQGRAVPGSPVPVLAGMPAEHTVRQMLAFKAGTLPATVMQQISKGYSDAQIAQIAAYFAGQKP